MVEPGDLKQLPHQTRQAADADLTTLVAQLLGNIDDRTESHTADICEAPQVDDKASESF